MTDFPEVTVSVCMITYNHEPFIRQAIEGVLMQRCNFSYELVIGEDFSNDSTATICRKYESEYKVIRLISSGENMGMIPNFIRTLQACNGKYIALCEGDDYWISPDKLQRQVDFLEVNSDYSMCFTDRMIVDAQNNILQKQSIPERFKKKLDSSEILGGFTPPLQTTVFKNSLLNNQQDFFSQLRSVYNGDTFLFSFLSTQGTVGYLNSVSAAYRLNHTGVYSNMDFYNRLKNRLNTINTLKEFLPDKYDRFIISGLKVVLQRLCVITLRKSMIKGAAGYFYTLFKLDIKTLDISVLRAFRLFFKSIFQKEIVITD